MSAGTEKDFFVGYAPPPRATGWFALKVGIGLIAGAFFLALALGWSVQDRSGGNYGAEITVRGYVANMPSPVVRALPDARYPQGRAMMIAGASKEGAAPHVDAFKGKLVEVKGGTLKRGTLDMLVVWGKGNFKEVPDARPVKLAEPVSLGRWKVAGEICDGKCLAGAMRPGTGLAHKACANLCIDRGQAAVFATVRPVAGQSYLLLADANGKLPPPAYRDYTALPVELEGEIVKVDDLLVFRVDWSKVRKQ